MYDRPLLWPPEIALLHHKLHEVLLGLHYHSTPRFEGAQVDRHIPLRWRRQEFLRS